MRAARRCVGRRGDGRPRGRASRRQPRHRQAQRPRWRTPRDHRPHAPLRRHRFVAYLLVKGSVVQHVGWVLRSTATKTVIEVHDYVDTNVPVLARERFTAYSSLGFDVPRSSQWPRSKLRG